MHERARPMPLTGRGLNKSRVHDRAKEAPWLIEVQPAGGVRRVGRRGHPLIPDDRVDADAGLRD
eukprot:7848398-Alexandrium_andersonii.AAC.1